MYQPLWIHAGLDFGSNDNPTCGQKASDGVTDERAWQLMWTGGNGTNATCSYVSETSAFTATGFPLCTRLSGPAGRESSQDSVRGLILVLCLAGWAAMPIVRLILIKRNGFQEIHLCARRRFRNRPSCHSDCQRVPADESVGGKPMVRAESPWNSPARLARWRRLYGQIGVGLRRRRQ